MPGRTEGERVRDASSAVRAELERRLSQLPGLERRPSRHGDSRSYFVAEREIAHFHGDERMDVRLTKERIREFRELGRLDARIATRGPMAEWVAVRLNGASDLAFALDLVEAAIRANA